MSLPSPTIMTVPFATSGTRNVVPLTPPSSPANAASYSGGFPAVDMEDPAAGGLPPLGPDFNGLYYDLSNNIAWQQTGQAYVYNSNQATANGYQIGAQIPRADKTGYWFNTVANNTSNPDSGGAGWVPSYNYGYTNIGGLTNANVTLTALQASKDVITLSGALTGNVQIILPSLLKIWLVVNNTTGASTVTVKPSAGLGAIIPQAGATEIPQFIYCDGTNIYAVGSGAISGAVVLNPAGGAEQLISGPLGVVGAGTYLDLWDDTGVANSGRWLLQANASENRLTLAAETDNLGSATAALTIQRTPGTAVVASVALGGAAQIGTTQAANDDSTNLATTAYADRAVGTLSTTVAAEISTINGEINSIQTQVGTSQVGYQGSGVSGIGTGYTAIIADTALVAGVYALLFDGELSGSGFGTLSARVIITTGTGTGNPVATLGGGVNTSLNSSGSTQTVYYGNAASMTGMPLYNSSQHSVLRGTFTMPSGATSVTLEFAVTSGTLAVGAGSFAQFLRVN